MTVTICYCHEVLLQCYYYCDEVLCDEVLLQYYCDYGDNYYYCYCYNIMKYCYNITVTVTILLLL